MGWTPLRPALTPALTLREIQHIRHQVKAAGAELSAMLDLGGDLQTMWDLPRRYFVPEIGSYLPFPNGHLGRLVERVGKLLVPTEPVCRVLLEDTTAGIRWFELACQEISRERFKKEEANKAPASERSSCFW